MPGVAVKGRKGEWDTAAKANQRSTHAQAAKSAFCGEGSRPPLWPIVVYRAKVGVGSDASAETLPHDTGGGRVAQFVVGGSDE